MLVGCSRRCLSWRIFTASSAHCMKFTCTRSVGGRERGGNIYSVRPNTVPFVGMTLLHAVRLHGDCTGDRDKPLTLHITLADGSVRDVTAYEGQTLLDVATEHGLPIEGACAGSCACSTCHVYLENEAAMDLFEEPTDEENDMLDMAFFPQSTSRLGCQLKFVKEKHDGMKFTLPRATRNMYVDGYTATPH